jgi:hypothetical protein
MGPEGIIVKRLLEVRCGDVGWIYWDQDIVQWWPVVKMIMSLWVPLKAESFMTVSFSIKTAPCSY